MTIDRTGFATITIALALSWENGQSSNNEPTLSGGGAGKSGKRNKRQIAIHCLMGPP